MPTNFSSNTGNEHVYFCYCIHSDWSQHQRFCPKKILEHYSQVHCMWTPQDSVFIYDDFTGITMWTPQKVRFSMITSYVALYVNVLESLVIYVDFTRITVCECRGKCLWLHRYHCMWTSWKELFICDDFTRITVCKCTREFGLSMMTSREVQLHVPTNITSSFYAWLFVAVLPPLFSCLPSLLSVLSGHCNNNIKSWLNHSEMVNQSINQSTNHNSNKVEKFHMYMSNSRAR
jgi:hypothetical protein